MVRFKDRLYLFYSGNAYATARYATGYALCKTAVGPCRRPVRRPVLASGRGIAGPGGADAFVGRAGRLLLMYASWDIGQGPAPQRDASPPHRHPASAPERDAGAPPPPMRIHPGVQELCAHALRTSIWTSAIERRLARR